MKYIGLVGVSLSVAGLLLVSCNGKVNPEKESLSVDPPVIEAPKDLASHSITVSSNVPWMASFLDAGGTEATWASSTAPPAKAMPPLRSASSRIHTKVLAPARW